MDADAASPVEQLRLQEHRRRELTFWFSPPTIELDHAQENALIEDGRRSSRRSSPTAFAIHQPDAWRAFVGETQDPKVLDLRTSRSMWRTSALGEGAKADERPSGHAPAQTLNPTRSRCVSVATTTRWDSWSRLRMAAIYSLIGIDTSAEAPPPRRLSEFETWVRADLLPLDSRPRSASRSSSCGRVLQGPPIHPTPGLASFPSAIPTRWVIKAAPTKLGRAGSSRMKTERAVAASSGPLLGAANGTATYAMARSGPTTLPGQGGASWRHGCA